MRLLTFQYKSKEMIGVLSPDKMSVLPLEQFGLSYPSMNDLIIHISEEEMELLKQAASGAGKSPDSVTIPLPEVKICAPIPEPRQDVICLGINYAAHAEESARYKNELSERNREYAVYFSKRVNEAVGHQSPIPAHSDVTERLDYEAELAVIIGKDACNVSAEDATDFIFGYTILNDISAREIQTRHKQWYFGKSLEGFCPMGPWIVTKDELTDPGNLAISSHVNGELRQNSNTSLMIFSIPMVIEELSRGMKLKAGTIISMGTPAGVGMGFEPPRFLKPGDMVSCEVEGIGTLTNSIA